MKLNYYINYTINFNNQKAGSVNVIKPEQLQQQQPQLQQQLQQQPQLQQQLQQQPQLQQQFIPTVITQPQLTQNTLAIQQMSPEMNTIQKEQQKFLEKQLKERQKFFKNQSQKILKNLSKKKKLIPPNKLQPAKTILNVPNKVTSQYQQPTNYNSDKITLKDLYLNPYYRNLNNSKIFRDSEFNYIKFDNLKGFESVKEYEIDKKYKMQENQQVFLDPTYGLIKYNESLKSFQKVN